MFLPQHKGMRYAVILIGLLGFGVLVFFDPHTSKVFPPCPFRIVTGFYCPGCGSTRALYLLLHGHIIEALTRNPLMVISIPILVAMLLKPSITSPKWVPWAAFWILILYGIARNLPFFPFTLIAPQG